LRQKAGISLNFVLNLVDVSRVEGYFELAGRGMKSKHGGG